MLFTKPQDAIHEGGSHFVGVIFLLLKKEQLFVNVMNVLIALNCMIDWIS